MEVNLVRFTLEEIDPGTHWIGGWLGCKTGLKAVERRKILPYRKLNTGLPARRPSI
jgi:hypothetical protein